MKILKGGWTTATETVKPRRVYTCTSCGKTGFWDKGWSWYGSLALSEACPADLPYACSEECRKVSESNIKSGKWVLPKARMTPGGGVIIKKRKGY